ncbi:MAG TPA: SDR family oxidoreductase [Bryobacteraceae bacterium]|jgi:NAD(P)-dependent dehydrogenase (short-subunit alcohol dehydrogenase family)|nr:SDR family oxidoreductase [Bryobacteraceae bacterium]
MDLQLAGKLVYISAGAWGIGEAAADRMTQEGASVIVGDNDETALQAKVTRWTGGVAADLATAAGVDHAVSYVRRTFGRAPDILINNLGVGDSADFERLPDERWARSFEINLMGSVRTCRALVPEMAARGGAAVVITGSDLVKQPEPGLMDYGAFKAGLLYFAKALAKQYAPRVRVNTVLPGPVWTRMWTRPGGLVDQLVSRYGVEDRDAAVRRFVEDRYLPLGIGRPEDVANAIAFLASPRAGFITGATLDIGGTLRGLI